MIKKETVKNIHKIPGSRSLYEMQKIAELLIPLGEYYQCYGKISHKRDSKKHKKKYIEYV